MHCSMRKMTGTNKEGQKWTKCEMIAVSASNFDHGRMQKMCLLTITSKSSRITIMKTKLQFNNFIIGK